VPSPRACAGQLAVEAVEVADEGQAHAVLVEVVDFAVERLHEQLHERADFVVGPAPVFAGEREQGQRFDAALAAMFDRGAHGFCPSRWPSLRGSRRRCAQRPLPSMTIAMWRGMRAGESESISSLAGAGGIGV
jgi:hypothetical protein